MSYGSENICIIGEEFGANSVRRGTGTHDFTSFARDGKTVELQVWTSAPMTYCAECEAFQARLDRGDISHVVVTRRARSGPYDKPGENTSPTFTMYARGQAKKK